MYQQIITTREVPVVDVPTQCSFSHIAAPPQFLPGSPPVVNPDWTMIEAFIEAATDQVETLAAQALLNEQIVITFDFWPDHLDPRVYYDFMLYSLDWTALWWNGFPSKKSIELVTRPVITGEGSPPSAPAPVVTYYDENGDLQTLDPSVYTVAYDKITLNVDQCWPATDRRQDCIQITYWAGYSANDPTQVPARLKLAVMYLAGWYIENRIPAGTEPTYDVINTLKSLIGSFKSYRIPR
jgi:hypothetical protein